jgi:hypothetical protein
MPQNTFRALLREVTFTKEMLGSGAAQIRKANYAAHGLYAQAFANLSIGMERIGKLCLLLDHYIQTGGHFPTFKYLKGKIGHDLELLGSLGGDLASRHNISFTYLLCNGRPLFKYKHPCWW